MSEQTVKPGFCVAPWLESVLYNDGTYRICSRNHRSFGDWRNEPLHQLWKSEELQAFRKSITEGRYPDKDCAACHRAGTAQNFDRILGAPLDGVLLKLYYRSWITPQEYLSLRDIDKLFPIEGGESDAFLAGKEQELRLVQERLRENDKAISFLSTVETILRIVKSFRQGDAAPPVVGPFRQVQLIARCNARCVMCPGKFTKEIETGDAIEESLIPASLDQPRDIVDFFCNGSEFLLFKGWKEIARRLREGECYSLRVSTNGMLLTEENGRYLIDNDLIGHFNVSLNAGTQESLERIQKNVRFPKLMKNIEAFVDYAREKDADFPLSFSFIVLRSNLHELPAFLRMVSEFKKRAGKINPHVMIMSLENAGLADYRTFLFEEHPAFVPREEMEKVMRESAALAEELGIQTVLYNFGGVRTLREFVDSGFPLPGFIPLPVDIESIDAEVRRPMKAIYEVLLEEKKREVDQVYTRILTRCEQPYPLGDQVLAADALEKALLQQLREELEKIGAQGPPPVFRFVFPLYPEYEKHHEEYFQKYARHLEKWAPELLEAYHREVFTGKFGGDRERLPDHYGEKYVNVSPDLVRPGARVLGKDHRVWRLVLLTEQLVYLESEETEELVAHGRGFYRGVFLLDQPPGPMDASLMECQSKARIHYAGFMDMYAGLGHEARQESFETYKMVLDEKWNRREEINCYLDRLRCRREVVEGEDFSVSPDALELGTAVYGRDHRIHFFIAHREGIVYLRPDGESSLELQPFGFLKGALPLEERPPRQELEALLRKAHLHWQVNRWKNRLFGQRKSMLLWRLSCIYRYLLRLFRFQMPADLVIREKGE